MLKKILGLFSLISVGLIAWFKKEAQRLEAERNEARQDARIVKAVVDYHENADRKMAQLVKKQREENIHAKNNTNTSRNQLDNDY